MSGTLHASAQEIDRVGDNGLKTTEGVVARVDRTRRRRAVVLATAALTQPPCYGSDDCASTDTRILASTTRQP